MSAFIRTGDLVRLNRAARERMRWVRHPFPRSGLGPVYHMREHLQEFGRCVGVVDGLVGWPSGEMGPELDVRWLPSRLQYMYDPSDLELVRVCSSRTPCACSSRTPCASPSRVVRTVAIYDEENEEADR